MASVCLDMLANCIVTRAGGAQFAAMKTTQTDETFDGRAVGQGTTLDYLATLTPPLQPDDILTLSGKQWRVMSDPTGDDNMLTVIIRQEP